VMEDTYESTCTSSKSTIKKKGVVNETEWIVSFEHFLVPDGGRSIRLSWIGMAGN
jgi:hypothetical protein